MSATTRTNLYTITFGYNLQTQNMERKIHAVSLEPPASLGMKMKLTMQSARMMG